MHFYVFINRYFDSAAKLICKYTEARGRINGLESLDIYVETSRKIITISFACLLIYSFFFIHLFSYLFLSLFVCLCIHLDISKNMLNSS